VEVRSAILATAWLLVHTPVSILRQNGLTYRRNSLSVIRACERSVSGRFSAHRSSLLLWHPLSAPLPLRDPPAPAPFPLTGFSARSAPITCSKHFIYLYSP